MSNDAGQEFCSRIEIYNENLHQKVMGKDGNKRKSIKIVILKIGLTIWEKVTGRNRVNS